MFLKKILTLMKNSLQHGKMIIIAINMRKMMKIMETTIITHLKKEETFIPGITPKLNKIRTRNAPIRMRMKIILSGVGVIGSNIILELYLSHM